MSAAKKPRKDSKGQPATELPKAHPVRDEADLKDAKPAIVGAKIDPEQAYKPGDKFAVPIWSVKLIEELATVALGRRTTRTNPIVHEAQRALLMLAIPAYVDRARHDNEFPGQPYPGFNLEPELHRGACDGVANLLHNGLHEEAGIISRALRRLEAIDETWNSPDFGSKQLLKTVAVRIDLAMRGKTPTKQVLRSIIYGDRVAESQVSREFKRITGLRNLPGAKPGPKPGSVRGKAR